MREYKTQMEAAKKGIITEEMKIVAKKEYLEPEKIMELVKKGEVAIPCNINHKSISPEGIGTGLRTKINVNLGISGDCLTFSQSVFHGKHGCVLHQCQHGGSGKHWHIA